MSVSLTATRVKLYGYKVLVEGAAVYNPGSEWLYLTEWRRQWLQYGLKYFRWVFQEREYWWSVSYSNCSNTCIAWTWLIWLHLERSLCAWKLFYIFSLKSIGAMKIIFFHEREWLFLVFYSSCSPEMSEVIFFLFFWFLFFFLVYVFIKLNNANCVYIFFNDNHTDHPSVWIPYI